MKLTRTRTEIMILFIFIVLLGIATGASAGAVCCQDVDALSCGPGGYTVVTEEVVCEPSACIVIEDGVEARGACEQAGQCDGTTCIKILKVQHDSECGVSSKECCPTAKECCIKL
ncbi:MAG: hypothetical protein ABIJ00_10040 [Candidatus Eisenbacteria bacterium]